MTTERETSCLSAIFVDFDNLYLSLRRKNEEAARRFAKDPALWTRAIATGELMSSDGSAVAGGQAGEPDGTNRRIVINRCYGNPVPRRNANDSSTDGSSFIFVRENFVRTGAEVIDCPPLTAQLKNSSDIRMVMDMRDMLTHDTHLDEFIILSGDADFTPVLTRLRAHARRTVIYANEQTAQAYASLADARINEIDLITLLMSGQTNAMSPASNASVSEQIIAAVMQVVDSSNTPVPIETLADRAQRALGHEQTVGTSWAGYGGFLALLKDCLPDRASLQSKDNSYTVSDRSREPSPPSPKQDPAPQMERSPGAILAEALETTEAAAADAPAPSPMPAQQAQPAPLAPPPLEPVQQDQQAVQRFDAEIAQPAEPQPNANAAAQPAEDQSRSPATLNTAMDAARLSAASQPEVPGTLSEPVSAAEQTPIAPPAPAPALEEPSSSVQLPSVAPPSVQVARSIQESITRIHEASHAPALSHTDYQILFTAISNEIVENGINGTQTVVNIGARAHNAGINIKANDIVFVLNKIGEADPYFNQGTSPALFAKRFQNYVIACCRNAGLQLTVEELGFIETWFTAGEQTEAERAADAEWQRREQQEQARTQGDAPAAEGLPQFLQNRA